MATILPTEGIRVDKDCPEGIRVDKDCPLEFLPLATESRLEFEWTGGIRFWPQLMDNEERVLDEHGHLTVLTEW